MQIVLMILILVCLITWLFLITFMEYLPELWNKKSYRIWKECYENDNFALENVGQGYNGTIYWYKSPDLPYTVYVFFDDEEPTACIFWQDTLDIVFSTFYKKHSRKLAKKLLGNQPKD